MGRSSNRVRRVRHHRGLGCDQSRSRRPITASRVPTLWCRARASIPDAETTPTSRSAVPQTTARSSTSVSTTLAPDRPSSSSSSTVQPAAKPRYSKRSGRCTPRSTRLGYSNLGYTTGPDAPDTDSVVYALGFAGVGGTPIDPVPEPGSMLLLGTGLSALAVRRRRKALRRKGETTSGGPSPGNGLGASCIGEVYTRRGGTDRGSSDEVGRVAVVAFTFARRRQIEADMIKPRDNRPESPGAAPFHKAVAAFEKGDLTGPMRSSGRASSSIQEW